MGTAGTIGACRWLIDVQCYAGFWVGEVWVQWRWDIFLSPARAAVSWVWVSGAPGSPLWDLCGSHSGAGLLSAKGMFMPVSFLLNETEGKESLITSMLKSLCCKEWNFVICR
jgi:hypothetical protein